MNMLPPPNAQSFADVIRLAPSGNPPPPTDLSRLFASETRSPGTGTIPLSWFQDRDFAAAVVEKFSLDHGHMIRLVFDTPPVVRQCRDGNTLRHSSPEIPVWTSMGEWMGCRSDQRFNAPDFKTIFISMN